MVKLTDEQKARVRTYLAALRSGEYLQGTGRLRCENKFCCLGIACEVFAKENPVATWKPSGLFHFSAFYANEESWNHYLLPPEVAAWFGFPTEDPALTPSFNATGCNDVAGISFAEIADLFEAKFLSDDETPA